jgi:DNA-directed RNA polymerase sigma subunit (sigma70/sigma32)
MADDGRGMDEQTLQDLFERHNLAHADGRDSLQAMAQEAYRLGWTHRENQRARKAQQLEELVRDDVRRQAALARLTPEERRVAELRLGFGEGTPGQGQLIKKVSRKIGISGERIRELERSAIAKMLAEEPEE